MPTKVLSVTLRVHGGCHSQGCLGYLPHSLAAPSVFPGNFPTPIYWQWITLAITCNEPTLQLLL